MCEEIVKKKEPLFFSYSSKWYVDLEDSEVESNYTDISCFEITEDTDIDARFNVFLLSKSGKPLFYRFGEDEHIIPLLGVAYTLFNTVTDPDFDDYFNEESNEDVIDLSLHSNQRILNAKKVETLNPSPYLVISGTSQTIIFLSKSPLLLISKFAKPQANHDDDVDYNPQTLLTNLENGIKNLNNNKSSFASPSLGSSSCFQTSIYQQFLCLKRMRDFILSVATQSALVMAYEKYHNFNLNTFLAGSEKMLNFWCNRLESNLCLALSGIQYLQCNPPLRNSIQKIMVQAVADKNVIFSLLLHKQYVINLVQSDPYVLTITDLHLLMNMVESCASTFKSSEITCTPICLPNFNSEQFLSAHVSYLDVRKRFCLIFLTFSFDHSIVFPNLSAAKNSILMNFNDKDHLTSLSNIIEERKHVYTISQLRSTKLVHNLTLSNSPSHNINSPTAEPSKKANVKPNKEKIGIEERLTNSSHVYINEENTEQQNDKSNEKSKKHVNSDKKASAIKMQCLRQITHFVYVAKPGNYITAPVFETRGGTTTIMSSPSNEIYDREKKSTSTPTSQYACINEESPLTTGQKRQIYMAYCDLKSRLLTIPPDSFVYSDLMPKTNSHTTAKHVGTKMKKRFDKNKDMPPYVIPINFATSAFDIDCLRRHNSPLTCSDHQIKQSHIEDSFQKINITHLNDQIKSENLTKFSSILASPQNFFSSIFSSGDMDATTPSHNPPLKSNSLLHLPTSQPFDNNGQNASSLNSSHLLTNLAGKTGTGNENISFIQISLSDGIACCWKDLRYELYAYFKPSATDSDIAVIKQCIVKWVQQDYKNLFPLINL